MADRPNPQLNSKIDNKDAKYGCRSVHSAGQSLNSYSKAVLRGLNALRSGEILCDVTLIVENITFKAHRVVLAACSDYFLSMFTDAMCEAEQAEIKLIGIKAKGVELLIDYIYSGKLELCQNNVEDVLAVAAHFQIPTVIEDCCNYLKSQIDLENCVAIASLAELYTLDSLKYKTYRYMCSRLEEFSQGFNFQNLTRSQLQFILTCNYPIDCSEETLVKIVLEYCMGTNVPTDVAEILFSRINFNQIDEENLKNVLAKNERKFGSFMEIINKEIAKQLEAQSVTETESKADLNITKNKENLISKNDLFNTRGMELALVKIGGYEHSGLTNQISYYLPSVGKWEHLTVIPHIEQCNYGTAVLGNELYIVGGSYDDCLKEFIHPFGFRYCPIKDKWHTIAPIQKDRCRFSLNAVGNYLYAVGGELMEYGNDCNRENDLDVLNCERYNVDKNYWEYLSPLPENRSLHAGVAYKNKLYISGGCNRNWVLSSLWCFDIDSKEWQELGGMPTPRADHYLIAYEGYIYACGGWTEDVLNDHRILVDTIDVYDIDKDTWSIETTNPMPKYYTGVAALKQRIYFIGGLFPLVLCPYTNDRATKFVQCYDLETKEWSVNDEWEYPKEIWESTLSSFYVPRKHDNIKDYWKSWLNLY